MSGKIFFASVIASLLIMAPVTYFVLPLLYPGMKEESGVVQSIYREFDETAYISDSTDVFELVNSTAMVVSTQGGSFLSILLTMPCVMTLDPVMTGTFQIEIALVVGSVGNRTNKVAFYRQSPLGSYSEYPVDVTLNYVTDNIAAGNYTIFVHWRVLYDIGGLNYLIANNPPNYDYVRSLFVQEIVA